MKRLTQNIYWDGETKTLYVRRRSQGVPELIEEYRRTLERTPEDCGTRFMLAGCLYGIGRTEEAKAEWEAVKQLGGEEWAQIIAETLNALRTVVNTD